MKNKILALLAVAAVGSVATAQTDATTAVTTSITGVTTLSINNSTLGLTPAVGAPDSDGTSILSYSSNDGEVYSVSVVSDGWATATDSTVFPVLTASSTAGTVPLISSGNVASPAGDIVTGIESETSTAAVTLAASVTVDVVAGDYATELTYTIE